ncbi:hypothetical protein Acr_00g0071530 [Actinidia rufa]|uniref:Uncharacterized protein n=1 Tax=Actinidia rufa TaxID=165716 RepID=A0A7J0DTN6_9ERIC|nr:hypothetical protein Acr_00g0071530 [Actinidia rufa]
MAQLRSLALQPEHTPIRITAAISANVYHLLRRPAVRGSRVVAFYGESAYGWFEPRALIPFDPQYTEKSKQTNTKAFLTAVAEAKYEVNRRAAYKCSRIVDVDVTGFEPGIVYALKQIKRARDGFQPRKTLTFVQKLALIPQSDMQINVEWTKNVAHLLAYWRAVFQEFNEMYAQEFGVHSPGRS